MLAAVSRESTALSMVGSSGASVVGCTVLGSQACEVVSKTCINTSDGGLLSTPFNVSFVITRRSLCTASKCSAPWREPVALAAT